MTKQRPIVGWNYLGLPARAARRPTVVLAVSPEKDAEGPAVSAVTQQREGHAQPGALRRTQRNLRKAPVGVGVAVAVPRVGPDARVVATATAGTVLNCSQLDPWTALPSLVLPSTVKLYCSTKGWAPRGMLGTAGAQQKNGALGPDVLHAACSRRRKLPGCWPCRRLRQRRAGHLGLAWAPNCRSASVAVPLRLSALAKGQAGQPTTRAVNLYCTADGKDRRRGTQ